MREFSVIIPARNAAPTLSSCLDAVFSSSAPPREVIVVDDGSSDGTAQVASRFPCRIVRTAFGVGPMEPRFAGALEAQSGLLVFVDADVSVRRETFARLLAHFQDPGLHAVTGLLARDTAASSFFAAFKNEYMNHIFRRQRGEVHFLYGSLWAIRKEEMIFFEPIRGPFGSLVSDSELGLRLARKGRRILLDQALEVDHLKPYSFRSLIVNDFSIPFLFALMALKYGNAGMIAKHRTFSHASLAQVAATLSGAAAGLAGTWFVFSGSPLSFFLSLLPLGVFFGFWAPFLWGLRSRGPAFAAASALFLLADSLAMTAGMAAGLLYGLLPTLGFREIRVTASHA